MNVFVMIWIAQPSLLRHLLIIIREYPVNKLDLNAGYQVKKYALSNAAGTGKLIIGLKKLKK
jgi:hypothetical protein